MVDALPRSERPALAVLAGTSAAGSVGLAAGGTAGALLATDLAGTQSAAGLPLGLLVLGSAASAVVISWQTNRAGRARALALGYVAGTVGAALTIVSAAAASLVLLLAGSVLLGSANASVFLTRYAAADIGGAAAGGRALGLTLFATSAGAIASPLLLGPTGAAAAALGLPRLSGIYALAALAFAGAAAALATTRHLPRGKSVAAPPRRALVPLPARYGVAVLAAVNFVMVGLMAVAPVHLMGHGHDLEMIGAVISLHVAGMFAPSPVSGWLADRVGPEAVATTGCLLVLVAVAGAAVAGIGALVLLILGIGWNFGVVGASALIARTVDPSRRTSAEAIGEVAMGVAAAAGAPLAGVLIR